MEKFFEVKGTTIEKIEKVIFKVGVIPILITIVMANVKATILGIALASIYLFVFFFITQMKK